VSVAALVPADVVIFSFARSLGGAEFAFIGLLVVAVVAELT
jgi:hypothetical protein